MALFQFGRKEGVHVSLIQRVAASILQWGARAPTVNRPQRPPLWLEHLEDRIVPAVTAYPDVYLVPGGAPYTAPVSVLANDSSTAANSNLHIMGSTGPANGVVNLISMVCSSTRRTPALPAWINLFI